MLRLRWRLKLRLSLRWRLVLCCVVLWRQAQSKCHNYSGNSDIMSDLLHLANSIESQVTVQHQHGDWKSLKSTETFQIFSIVTHLVSPNRNCHFGLNFKSPASHLCFQTGNLREIFHFNLRTYHCPALPCTALHCTVCTALLCSARVHVLHYNSTIHDYNRIFGAQ